MAGKLVEISPELSLHADEIREMRLNEDRSRLLVRTAHTGVVEVLPLQAETAEIAHRRIFAAVNGEANSGMQLIEVDKGTWVDPADVVQVLRYGGRYNGLTLIMRGGLPDIELSRRDDGTCSADIASRINAVMRERRLGLNAI